MKSPATGREYADGHGLRFLYLVRPIVLAVLAAGLYLGSGPALASVPFVAFLLVVSVQDLRIHLRSVRRAQVTADRLVLTTQFGSPRSIRWEDVRELQLADRQWMAKPRRVLRLETARGDYFAGSDLPDFDDLVSELASRSARSVRPFTRLEKFLLLQWGI